MLPFNIPIFYTMFLNGNCVSCTCSATVVFLCKPMSCGIDLLNGRLTLSILCFELMRVIVFPAVFSVFSIFVAMFPSVCEGARSAVGYECHMTVPLFLAHRDIIFLKDILLRIQLVCSLFSLNDMIIHLPSL